MAEDLRQNDAARHLDALRLLLMIEVTLENAAFALLPLPFMDSVSSVLRGDQQ